MKLEIYRKDRKRQWKYKMVNIFFDKVNVEDRKFVFHLINWTNLLAKTIFLYKQDCLLKMLYIVLSIDIGK